MKTVKTILNIIAWLVTVIFQITIGFLAGYIFFAEGYGNIVFMWIGITSSVFLIGLVATVFRRTFTSKKYLLRLGLTALGASFSLIYFYQFDFFYNADYEMYVQYPFLAAVGGVIGFYMFGWLVQESSYWKVIRIIGYGVSVLVISAEVYVLWDWLTPFSLPIQNLRPNQALNMELVNIVGDGSGDDVGTSFQLWDLDGGIHMMGIKGVVTTDESSLYIMDFSDPALPILSNLYDVGDYYYVIGMYESYVYMYVEEEIQVLDISNSIEPIVVWHYDIDWQHARMFIHGKYAYLVDEIDGIYVYDVSNSAKPVLINHQVDLTEIGYISGFDATGQYFYVFGDHRVYVFDASDPAKIVETAVINKSFDHVTTMIGNLAFLDDSLYIGNEPATLSIVELSNPEQLRLVSSYHWLQWSNISGASEGKVYIADWSDGIHVVDFSNPKDPKEIAYFGMKDGALSATMGKNNFVYVIPDSHYALYVLRYLPPNK